MREPGSEERIWWGSVNQPFEPDAYDALRGAPRCTWAAGICSSSTRSPVRTPLPPAAARRDRERLACAVRADHVHRPEDDELASLAPEAACCTRRASRRTRRDGTRAANFERRCTRAKEVVIGGTQYAGEIKKSIFTVMNYLLPQQGVLSMHCSANVSGKAATSPCSSASRAPARRRSRPTRRGRSSATTSTAGATTASSTSRAAATPSASTSRPRPSRRSTRPPAFGTVLENVVIDPRHARRSTSTTTR